MSVPTAGAGDGEQASAMGQVPGGHRVPGMCWVQGTTGELPYGTGHRLVLAEGVRLCPLVLHCTPWLEEEIREVLTHGYFSRSIKNT